MNNTYNNITFTSKCPQIRDAQWVVHVVNSAFPHISSTRFSAAIYKLKTENSDVFCRFTSEEPFSLSNPFELKELKLAVIFDWHKRIIAKINSIRNKTIHNSKTDTQLVSNIIRQLQNHKIGNCGEDALLSEAILKINGVDNACTARLKIDKRNIDHSVCIFNKDGSPFDGNVTKNTIIIDPWLGSADFAPNIFLKYKNLCKKYFFNIKANSKIEFRNINTLNISKEERFLLALGNKEILFPEVTHSFMH